MQPPSAWPLSCARAGVRPFATRTPTLPPATHTNSYLIDLGDGFLLVEPAPSAESEQLRLLEWVRAQCTDKPLRALLATHHHPDHVGAAAWLGRQLEVPLWGHALLPVHRPDCVVARTLGEGDALGHGWQALHTPGHASDHLCLWHEAERVLVVGDMVASVGTIVVPPEDGSMREYLRQLHRLDALDPAVMLPAHGAPIENAHEVFAYYIDHRMAREAKIAKVLAAAPGFRALAELLPLAYDDAPQKSWPIAIYSLHAHLDKLVEDGRARRDADGRYASEAE